MSAETGRATGGSGAGPAREPSDAAGRILTSREVGGGLGQALRRLETRVGAAALDTLWVFPPRLRGRREHGLVVAGCFTGEEGRRQVVTAIYQAERTGQGLQMDAQFFEEGVAPPERLPRIIAGVVRRSDDQPGEPRRIEIGGAAARFDALLAEVEADV
ncbi:MAG: hypothetical protein HY704_08420 [Gemmatimonadetes bacterium]|nr:hypothetical protein [Gemmatimonadota bacterium]